ncbi:hypothetical protein [Dietzia psychralcaliphila]|uniref:Uncharacterized protein n=1 Tax=Dietzia psychralcaliphila TaxID=139021 RepID=A0AAD0NN87_9ACTN|nr:hypothetical protein [Dietzia psychralcaliphila]AWH96400.1 hypothetical protein A6048_13890 [Dietzia psychralcaliphila]PTM90470.1 hypothetical protein C8N39_101223 [Dietzia psychralcaliphila]
MDTVEPGLFDLPEPAPEPTPQPSPARPRPGRNRETWSCTVSAEVAIVDAAAVTAALAQYREDTVVVDAFSGAVIEDPASEEAGPDPTLPPLPQLNWLIWPTGGLEELLEEGAFRVFDVESAVTSEAADRGTATWTVTVKLTDVQLLRRVATRAQPADAVLIASSLAVAWLRAADSFAPLRSIPGISWRPVSVDIAHVPARKR